MDYIKSLIFPLNDKCLYHTLIGKVIKSTYHNYINYIYFEKYPTVKFHINTTPSEDFIGNYYLIHYTEVIQYGYDIGSNIYDDSLLFDIKSMNIIESESICYLEKYKDKFNIHVSCLCCGDEITIDKFKKCHGKVVKHYIWDDTMLEDKFRFNGCDECYCSRRHYPGTSCKKYEYDCNNCYQHRKIEVV
jgi:hypothetical protein